MKKYITVSLIIFSGIFTCLFAQTAYVMPDKWYDNIVYANDNNTKIPLETKFNVTFDEKAITIRVKLQDHYVQNLKNLPKGTDNVWPRGENIEIFLDPGRTCSNYQQIAVGANNDRWDKRWLKKTKTSWTAKTKITSNGWETEIRLPYSDEGMVKPQLGDTWGFNLCRNVINPQNNGRYFSTWAHVGAVFNRPDKFGKLIFGDPDLAKKSQLAKVRKELKKLTVELKQKGLYQHFAARIKMLEVNGSEIDVRDIKDEMLVLEKLKGL